jgi:hypothetical protein
MVPKVRAALAALGWDGAEAIIADSSAPTRSSRALDDPTFGTRITREPRRRRWARRERRPQRHAQALRQRAIRDLVASRPVGSQRELVDALAEQGFAVTQATVSRDITELGCSRRRGAGGHVYVRRTVASPRDPPASTTPRRILADIPCHHRPQRADPRADRHARHGQRRSPRRSTSRPCRSRKARCAGDNTLLVLFADEPRSSAGSTIQPHPGSIRRSKSREARSSSPTRADSIRRSPSPWLQGAVRLEVVTLTVDLGGGSLREGVERRAMSPGARGRTSSTAASGSSPTSCGRTSRPTPLYQGAYPLATRSPVR